jgi:hypothetical protein
MLLCALRLIDVEFEISDDRISQGGAAQRVARDRAFKKARARGAGDSPHITRNTVARSAGLALSGATNPGVPLRSNPTLYAIACSAGWESVSLVEILLASISTFCAKPRSGTELQPAAADALAGTSLSNVGSDSGAPASHA